MSEYKGVLAEMWEEGTVEFSRLLNMIFKTHHLEDVITGDYSPDYLPSYKFIETINGFGETHWTVFSWKGKYYKVQYNHRSHEGASYYRDGSEIKEVFPKQVEVTVYE